MCADNRVEGKDPLSNKVLAEEGVEGDFYKLPLQINSSPESLLAEEDTGDVWHACLGHLHTKVVKSSCKLSKECEDCLICWESLTHFLINLQTPC